AGPSSASAIFIICGEKSMLATPQPAQVRLRPPQTMLIVPTTVGHLGGSWNAWSNAAASASDGAADKGGVSIVAAYLRSGGLAPAGATSAVLRNVARTLSPDRAGRVAGSQLPEEADV